MLWSVFICIAPATQGAFFNLSYCSEPFASTFAYLDEVLEDGGSVLGIVYLRVELKPKTIQLPVLHSLNCARIAMSDNGEPRR